LYSVFGIVMILGVKIEGVRVCGNCFGFLLFRFCHVAMVWRNSGFVGLNPTWFLPHIIIKSAVRIVGVLIKSIVYDWCF
jgi:hypothetical protein